MFGKLFRRKKAEEKEYRFASYCSIGGRENNEDSCSAEDFADGCLLVVADGLGGCDRGEIASQTAVETIRSYYRENAEEPDIEEAINLANSRVIEAQGDEKKKMKTTITVAHIMKDRAILAHVGDSRIYAFQNGEIVYQSIDHSASQMAVLVGKITADQIRHHEDRNILTRALGVSYDLKVDMTSLGVWEYDALLLCSDGFWEYITEEDMCKCLKKVSSPQQWLEAMCKIADAAAPSNRDNNTAVAMMRGN